MENAIEVKNVTKVFKLFYDEDIVIKIKSLGKEEEYIWN